MIRLFTALSVPDDVAEALARRQTGLPGASWRTADQLHITLAFYGEIDERRADDLSVGVAPPSVRENPNSYRPVLVTRPMPSSSGGSGGGYSGGK